MNKIFSVLLCLGLCIGLTGCENSTNINEKIDKYFNDEGYKVSFENPYDGITYIDIENDNIGLSSIIRKNKVDSVQYHNYDKSMVVCDIYNPNSKWKATSDQIKRDSKTCESNLKYFLKDSGFTKKEIRDYIQYLYEENN